MPKSHRTPFLLHGLLWRYRSLTAKNFSNTPGKPVDEIRAQAKKAGVSEMTLRRAKDKERIKARRVPLDGVPSNKWPWEWYAPTP